MLLEVRDLRVVFRRRGQPDTVAVDGVSFDVPAGQVVGLVGESGSGRSALAMAVMRQLPRRGVHVEGQVLLDGVDLLTLSDAQMRERRGRDLSMVRPRPRSALNPLIPLGPQLTGALRRHRGLAKAPAREAAVELLDRVGIADPRRGIEAYPRQLSSSARSRVLIAVAAAGRPRLLVADELTAALDVTTQAQILTLLRELVRETGAALLMTTHDLGVVAGTCETVNVRYAGRIVERAQRHRLFGTPRHPYTHGLLGAIPPPRRAARPRTRHHQRFGPRSPAVGAVVRVRAPLFARAAGVHQGLTRRRHQRGAAAALPQPRARERRVSPLLDVRDLVVPAAGRRRLRRARTLAVDGVSLQVHRGETYGVVGESGSGAADLARAIATPAPRAAGRVLLDGVDVEDMDAPQRRRRIRMLRPGHDRATVATLLVDEMRSAGLPEPAGDELRDLVAVVELPVGVLRRSVQELTDGQRRRVDVARALCTGPDLLVADDPVAGLDVTVAAQLLDLLGRVKTERGLSCLLIARDLGVVRHLSDRVGVLDRGRIVEESPAGAFYRTPRHPYTRALLSAVPVPDPEVEDRRERILLTGDPPSAADPAGGCAFHPRCSWGRPERCADERPLLRTVAGVAAGHLVACHYSEDSEDIEDIAGS